MIQLHINGEHYVGSRVLKGTTKELACKRCHQALDVYQGIMYGPSLKVAWCRPCFDDRVPSRHWWGTAIDHEDIKVDKIEVIEVDA